MATVLIGGGTGFIGMHLSRRLRRDGHEVRHLSRSERPEADFATFHWDIQSQTIDDRALDGVDYVINLAGAGIADKRWTDDRKRVIIDSRTESTRLLARTFTRLDRKPRRYLSASAIGFYGNRGDALMTEESTAGDGFLSESCVAWERSVAEVAGQGIPTFINRTGIVLHPDEGALEKMLIPLNFYTSAYFGDGLQWYSWVHIEDLVGIYAFALEHDLTGVYNGCAPHPVRNKHFAAALGPATGKPGAFVIPAPVFALQLALGEMRHTVTDSARCSTAKIEGAGFRFAYPELSQALGQLLGK